MSVSSISTVPVTRSRPGRTIAARNRCSISHERLGPAQPVEYQAVAVAIEPRLELARRAWVQPGLGWLAVPASLLQQVGSDG